MVEERTCPRCGGIAVPTNFLGTSYEFLDCGYNFSI